MARRQHGHTDVAEEIYVAGTVAPAGTYQMVGGNLIFVLEEEGYLPASLDGRVACYEPVRRTWRDFEASEARQQELV